MLNKIFYPGSYPKQIDGVLLLLRVTVAVFMLTHGIGKLYKLFSGDPVQFPDPIGLGASASLILTVFSEVCCSVLLLIGFTTRLAAIPLLITMLVAAFVVHATDGFGRQELPLMYAVIYLSLGISGAGKISIDNLIFNKLKQ